MKLKKKKEGRREWNKKNFSKKKKIKALERMLKKERKGFENEIFFFSRCVYVLMAFYTRPEKHVFTIIIYILFMCFIVTVNFSSPTIKVNQSQMREMKHTLKKNRVTYWAKKGKKNYFYCVQFFK